MSFKLRSILACTAVLLMTSTAHAQQVDRAEGAGFAGLLLGYADPTNADGRLGYGANVGLVFPGGLTGLIYLLNSSGDNDGTDVQIMHYGLGVDYSLSGMFEGPLAGFHAGLRLGMANIDVDSPIADASSDDFSYGVAAGYDFLTMYGISIGGEIDLLFTSGDDSVSTLYALITGKYWF